jgi:glucose/arabinose dehydrogenase
MARGGIVAVLVVAALLTPPAFARPHPGYRIPSRNPFAAVPGARPEVYVTGMRNPYRWSFDPPTGDLYIADVGGNLREEIDYLPRARIAGANLGWHCFEGTLIQKGCRPASYFPPAFEYPSSPDVVIGGFIVHSPDLPSFAGRYLYGQYQTGIWALGPQATGVSTNVSAAVTGVTSLGQDGAGHVYVTSYDGPLYRLGESAGALTVTQIGDFSRPVETVPVPGAPGALFVVEKRGTVQLLSSGVATKFLDIADQVEDEDYEQGLLGFVAAPDYATSRRTFAFYTDNRGDIQVDEYRSGARTPLLTIRHDQSTHHHGGTLAFGADGYLYLSTGDGDIRVDPQNDAQRLDSLLGKILRIDVSATKVDRRAPRLRASIKAEQRVLRLHGLAAYPSCGERCSVFGSAATRIGGRRYELEPAGATERAGQRRRLKLGLTTRATRALKRALKKHRAITVRLTLRAEDPTGNVTNLVRRVRVSG